MRIAFISDIHGNLPGLEAAVTDAEAHGADQIVCAGDLTGYGPFPDDVCRFIATRNIPSVIGNYDLKVIEAEKKGKPIMKKMKAKKRKILSWTIEKTGKQNIRFLSALPVHIDLRLPTGHSVLVVHGSPVSVVDTVYPSITRKGLDKKLGDSHPDILVTGHTHIPFVKRFTGILVINCGSVGYSIDGDSCPSYALIDTEEGKETHGSIIRFDYDLKRTIAALQRTDLPKAIQKDFSEGNKRRFTE